jgi:hypothetical protein
LKAERTGKIKENIMKVREGHVSNSSTSSFVLMTTKENYERALAEADPYVRAVAKALVDKEASKQVFLGRKMVVFSEYSDQGGNGTFSWLDIEYEKPKDKKKEDAEDEDEEEDEEDEEENEHEDKYLAWEKFQEILKKKKDEVIEASTG